MSKCIKNLLIIVTFSILLLTITLVVLADSNPADVPSSHWAYKAVKLLIDKGYLQLYQDQTFQGDKPVDRYTMAVIVAKILGEIAAGQVVTNKDDLALLKSLTNEYRNELVGISSKSNLSTKKADDVSKEIKIIKEDLTNLTAEQIELQKQAQQMLADIQSVRVDLERLKVELEKTKRRQTIYMIIAIILGLYGAAK